MPLGTFAELKTAVAGWLHRDDLAANIPDFIALAEARHARELRLRPMITTAPLATVAGVSTVALPARWLAFVSLSLPALSISLDPISKGVQAAYPAADTGAPKFYSVQGSSLVLSPIPDAVYSLTASYYEAPTPLSDADPTNWLLTAHPGLYLWAALAEAAPFLSSDARAATWEGKYAAELAQATASDSKSTGGSLRIRAR